jgi:hypothetical protein
VPGTGGDDQGVVRQRRRVGQDDAAPRRIDGLRFAEEDAHVVGLPQHPSDRRADVAWRERRRRDLIQQRLEEVVVVTIDERDVRARPGQRLGGREATEAAAKNDDVWRPHDAIIEG